MGEECDGQIPEAAVLTNVGAELTFQLPFNTADRFVSLFTEFDDHKKELGITTYGVSVTTMEEVFLNSAKVVDKEFARSISSRRNLNGQGVSVAEGTKHLEINEEEEEKKINRKDFTRTTSDIHENLFWRHFHANFLKRFQYAIRDKKMFVMELLIPVVFTTIVFTSVKIMFNVTNVPSYTMDTHFYNTKVDSDMKGKTRLVWDDYTCSRNKSEAVMKWLPEDRMVLQQVNVTELKTAEVCNSLARFLWCNDPVGCVMSCVYYVLCDCCV